MTAAAGRLHLTQPALSHAIRELETRLGVELFRRTKRRMELTPEGARVLQAGAVVLEEIERAEEDLLSFKDGRRGVLRVATHCYTNYHWIPKAIPYLEKSFPDVTLRIVPEATPDPIAALLAGRIDLAISQRYQRHTEIVGEELFCDELVAIMAPSHPLAGKASLEPEDFASEHLFLHGDLERALLLNRFLTPAGVHPAKISELGLSEAIFETVKVGLGISAAASWMVAAQVQAGELTAVPLGENGLVRSWHAVMLRRRSDWPALQELVRLLRMQKVNLGSTTTA